MSKCESCRKGYNGRNGNGYMPCGCKPKSKIDNTDLNNLLQKAIEAKPEFVEPPPLLPIGRPVLGYKPQPSSTDPYNKFNTLLMFILSACMIGLGVLIGVAL